MKQYYIQLFSPHGLIRFHNPEIGRDTDTGGQVKYLLELLEALSENPRVRKVDLITRKIKDRRVSSAYSQDVEEVNAKARIIRVPCGGSSYRKKETLWNHMDEFVDETIRFIKDEDDIPDVVHGHYADGNYAALEISKFFNVPLISTGHSLGKEKQKHLEKSNMSKSKINEVYSMDKRIAAENRAMINAAFVITSTQQEIDEQYVNYEGYEDALFNVIPPGTNPELFYPYYRQDMPSYILSIEQEQVLYKVSKEIDRFLFDANKPLILSLGRPDARKNFTTIIEAFGQDEELQTMANLAIFAGVRKDIGKMPEDEQEVLKNLLLLMDKYDLYGKLAIPKKNDPKLEIPEIYRIAARKRGVFINANPMENFGLTLIEAAACGLPLIASPKGGPKEIVGKCSNGILTNVESPESLANAIKEIITSSTKWDTFSANGIKGVDQHYSWKAHCEKYLYAIDRIGIGGEKVDPLIRKTNIGRKIAKADYFVICDLDGTLIEDEPSEDLEAFKNWVEENNESVIFGIATGRSQHLTKQALAQHDLPTPDILVCSAGSELYYTNNFILDSGFVSHISHQWKRDKISGLMDGLPKIRLQEETSQWPHKISYYVDNDFNEDDLANLYKLFDDNRIRANILLTDNYLLDILPHRASKGNAIKYLSYKWNIASDKFITAGNGGNDIDMLRGKAMGIVVSNYSPELEVLRKSKDVYFAQEEVSKGVMEGIVYYLSKKKNKES
jgi:sucrose-phosphate synthase